MITESQRLERITESNPALPGPAVQHVPKCHINLGKIQVFGSRRMSAQEVLQEELVTLWVTLQGFPRDGMTPPGRGLPSDRCSRDWNQACVLQVKSQHCWL